MTSWYLFRVPNDLSQQSPPKVQFPNYASSDAYNDLLWPDTHMTSLLIKVLQETGSSACKEFQGFGKCSVALCLGTVISLPTINTSTTVLHHTRPIRPAPNHTSTLRTTPDQSVTRQPSLQHAIPCRDTPSCTV